MALFFSNQTGPDCLETRTTAAELTHNFRLIDLVDESLGAQFKEETEEMSPKMFLIRALMWMRVFCQKVWVISHEKCMDLNLNITLIAAKAMNK